MLKTRIITAAVLFGAFWLALFYLPSIGWISFSTLIATLAAWEWGALMGLKRAPRVLLGAGIALICIAIAFLNPESVGLSQADPEAIWRLGRWFYLPSAVFWLLIVPPWLRYRWVISRSILGVAVGLIVILPTWLALVQIRLAGEMVLMATMATVWLADIAAYFSGRKFGRHKLAPAISPGKTWEGVIGAVFSVVIYGFLLSPELPIGLSSNLLLLFFILVVFTAVSVIGDLFESLLKRQAGLKDSGSILPGHGGVLDRIDSLTSVLPVAALVWQFFPL